MFDLELDSLTLPGPAAPPSDHAALIHNRHLEVSKLFDVFEFSGLFYFNISKMRLNFIFHHLLRNKVQSEQSYS